MEGRKLSITDVPEAICNWFVDVWIILKVQFPKKMFNAQCKICYQKCLSEKEELMPVEKQTVFSNKKIRNWMYQYNVSLQNPNKNVQVAQKGRKGHIVEFLEIILIVQKTFLDNYNTEPTAINWDQMSLSCKESSSQKH